VPLLSGADLSIASTLVLRGRPTGFLGVGLSADKKSGEDVLGSSLGMIIFFFHNRLENSWAYLYFSNRDRMRLFLRFYSRS